MTRARAAEQTRGVAPLARLEHHERCVYANCVSSLSTAHDRCRRRPWGGLPPRIGLPHGHLDSQSGVERVKSITLSKEG
jgi:hypothetical protein